MACWRAGSDFGPSDEQEWADGVEGGLAIGAGNQRVGDVEGEGGEAGDDEQPAGWPELVGRGAVQRDTVGIMITGAAVGSGGEDQLGADVAKVVDSSRVLFR